MSFEMDNLQMIPFDENDPEVIARRIKNRERQRRYRARKRQEADLKRANHPLQLQVDQTQVNIVDQTQVNIVDQTLVNIVDQTIVSDTPVNNNILARVYSQRNWKKDARSAHLVKQQKVQHASADLQLSGSQSNVIVDTQEHSSTPSGRNWKAEARNKRN